MKRKLAYILTLYFALIAYIGHAEERYRLDTRGPKVNVGIKAGFNSTIFFIDRFNTGGQELTDIQHNYKVGYLCAFFCRFNLNKHHFIQPELSYNISKGSLSVKRDKYNYDYLANHVLIKSTLHSIDFPILYGYKFIDTYPYGMAFFVGPKVSYMWKKHCDNDYTGFYQQQITENLRPINFSGTMGLAVNVSNIFFDFRYEIGLQNLAKSISYDKATTTAPYDKHSLPIKRRQNVISFSIGVIF